METRTNLFTGFKGRIPCALTSLGLYMNKGYFSGQVVENDQFHKLILDLGSRKIDFYLMDHPFFNLLHKIP